MSFVSALPFPRKPSADSLYHVLLCLCRLCMNRDEFEVSEDYLSRRAGINPYPTWEEQAAAESRPVVATTSPNHKSGSGCTNPPTGGDETAIPASGMLTARLGKNEIETASPRHVRDYPTSANARKRLSVLLKCVCDMDGGETGTKPFVRVAVGTNRYDDERVIQHGRAVGSLFRKVAGHSFWEKMSG